MYFFPPSIRTDYGKFNIEYAGPKGWNETDESMKPLGLRACKQGLKLYFLKMYRNPDYAFWHRSVQCF